MEPLDETYGVASIEDDGGGTFTVKVTGIRASAESVGDGIPYEVLGKAQARLQVEQAQYQGDVGGGAGPGDRRDTPPSPR